MDSFPVGRGSQLTPEQRREIQCCALLDGLSASEIARRTGRDRGTIANVLKAEDSRALRQQLETEAQEAAIKVLRGYSQRAARAWGIAIDAAADKGDHRPAKDLLLHTGAIEPVGDEGGTTRVAIFVGSPERPLDGQPPMIIDAAVTSEGE